MSYLTYLPFIFISKSGKLGGWYRNWRFFCAAIWVLAGFWCNLWTLRFLPMRCQKQFRPSPRSTGVPSMSCHHLRPKPICKHGDLSDGKTIIIIKNTNKTHQNFGYETQQKSTWNLKMPKFKKKIIIQTSIFGFNMSIFYGCITKIYIWKCHVRPHIKAAKFLRQSGCTMQNTWMRFLVQSRARHVCGYWDSFSHLWPWHCSQAKASYDS